MDLKVRHFIFLLLILLYLPSFGQRAAVISINNTGTDGFAFVLLEDFLAGEKLFTTERDYSDASNSFSATTESVVEYTVGINGMSKGCVVYIRENPSNTAEVSCTGGASCGNGDCGTATNYNSFSIGNTDPIYIFNSSGSGNSTSILGNVTEIYSVMYIDGSLAADESPSNDYPNALVTEISNGTGAAFYNTGLRSGAVTLSDLENASNYLTQGTELDPISTTFFSNITSGLPVELVQFEVFPEQNGSILLKWTTATEINNEKFIVERSIDGRSFESIGKVAGKGNSIELVSYSFEDKNPISGYNYYRLKQIDFDGAYEYSPIITIQVLKERSIFFYPNPADEFLFIKGIEIENAFYEIRSLTGTLIQKTTLQSQRMDISGLESGFYLLHLNVNNEIFTTKLIKR